MASGSLTLPSDTKAEKFKQTLLKRKQMNMQKAYFEKDSSLTHINIEILNQDGSKLIPFRNKDCQHIYCIYHVDELVEKYTHSGYIEKFDFTCEYCEKNINLKNFYLDYTLSEGINTIWDNYNKESIQVREVQLEPNGSVKPITTKVQAQRTLSKLKTQKTFGDNLKKEMTMKDSPLISPQRIQIDADEEEDKRINNEQNYTKRKTRLGSDEILSPGIMSSKTNLHKRQTIIPDIQEEENNDVLSYSFYYSNVPRFNEYNKVEFAEMLQQSTKTRDAFYPFVNPFEIPIGRIEFDNIMNDFQTSPMMAAFFVRYIKNMNKLNLPSGEDRDIILPFVVEKYDRYSQHVVFKYLKTFDNYYRGKGDEIQGKLRRIVLIFRYDDRWIMSIIDLEKLKCKLIDFLASDLSRASKEEIYTLIKAYLMQEFGLKPTALTLYEKAKVQSYHDCGMFIFRFLSLMYLENMEIDKISVDEGEKNVAKRVIPWLLLKIQSEKPPQLNLDRKKPIQRKMTIKPKQSILKQFTMKPTSPILDKLSFNMPDGIQSSINQALSGKTNLQSRLAPQAIQTDDDFNLDRISQQTPSETRSQVVRLKKNEVHQMLENAKDEILRNLNKEKDISDALAEEGLFAESDVSHEAVSKNQLKTLLKKLDNIKKPPTYQEDKPEVVPYEEYVQKYNEYVQEAMRFYQMLQYFQAANPEMYNRISKEIQDKIEEKMLDRFGLSSLRYGNQGNLLAKSLDLSGPNRLSPIFAKNVSPNPRNSKITSGFNIPLVPKKLPPLDPSVKSPSNVNFGSGTSTPLRQFKKVSDLNVARMSDLDAISQNNYAFGGESLPRKELIARRYGIEITKDAYKSLQRGETPSDDIINFYLQFLKEKQDYMSNEALDRHRVKIFYFGPDFYDLLSNGNPLSFKIKYSAVKHWTSAFKGYGETIFDVFHKLIFVIRVTSTHWAAVFLDNLDRKAFLFDTGRNQDASPINNPILYNISQFIEQEHQDKANRAMQIAKWQFIYGDMMKPEDIRDSALIVMKLVHNLQRGAYASHFAEWELKEFHKNLVDMIFKIGITANRKGELGSIERFGI